MKRFVWRLQRVLDVRIKQEQVKRTELFRVTQELAEKRTELLLRQQLLKEALASIGMENSSQRIGEQEMALRYAATNDEQIRRVKEAICTLEVRQKEKLAELLAVRQSREALERLREDTRQRFLQEQEKLDQKESDERAVIAFGRNR
jgi:flagellar export protein FliJ